MKLFLWKTYLWTIIPSSQDQTEKDVAGRPVQAADQSAAGQSIHHVLQIRGPSGKKQITSD